ncbi:MAG: glycosyltransferase, partial [Clostridiales bacterium]|nr:glycosyltransferase [Clostridiales bacterium]
MNVQIDVSVIFVNYNTKDMTINAINSVFEKTEGVSFEVIVVDNKSSDGSLDEFRKVFGSKIKTIDAGDNLGFGRANNLGAAAACGEYLFLLNTDTLLVNNAIKI